ncbi:hypothetical protein KCP69_17850 [Salmonella enterica subsp. enterica]|nr:hypothetical protein KCP69_17850 [Salmonella enterica subsp. enterica]
MPNFGILLLRRFARHGMSGCAGVKARKRPQPVNAGNNSIGRSHGMTHYSEIHWE